MPQLAHKKIGVRIDDLQMGVKPGLQWSGRMGFAAAEIAADSGEVCPAELSESGRRHLARLVRNGGMAFAALSQGSKDADLTNIARLDFAVESTIQAIRLAADMRVPVVSKDVGRLFTLTDADQEAVIAALQHVSQQAELVGTHLAIRSSLGSPEELVEVVQKVNCPSLKIAVDPGALIAAGYDPLIALNTAADQLAMAYVRDAQVGTPNHAGSETHLGQGALDLTAYIAQLSMYDALPPPILRRIDSTNPANDIAADRQTLADAMLT